MKTKCCKHNISQIIRHITKYFGKYSNSLILCNLTTRLYSYVTEYQIIKKLKLNIFENQAYLLVKLLFIYLLLFRLKYN